MKPHFIAFPPHNAIQQPHYLEERRRIVTRVDPLMTHRDKLEAIRDKIFRDNKYDETFSGKEIDLIEKLLSVSIEKGKIRDHDDIIKALQ